MIKDLVKYIFMSNLGYKYIQIFKKTNLNPFITTRQLYKQLSKQRQSYSKDVLEYLNVKVEPKGKVPKKDKVLYAINHRSLLDIMVMEHIFSLYEKNGVWIAKQELFDAFYGDFFKYSGCVGVDIQNKKGLLKFFKDIKNILAKVDDINIYIFPEGERNKKKDILKFQNGASKIAKSNKLDVVMVYIDAQLEKVFKDAPYKEQKTIKVYLSDMTDSDNLEEKYKEFIKKTKGENLE